MGVIVFLSVFLEVAVQIESEIKCKLVLILCRLALLPVEICSVYVQEQVFRLVADKCCLLVQLSVQLNLEIKFFF